MGRDDLISVIVPVYNVESYLVQCIDSLINQTYTNLEIILVDDGSTDTSGQICDEYARKDDRIVVVHKTNGGLSDARNAGLKVARGAYITYVDSDDFLYSSRAYELLVSGIETSNAKISVCRYVEFCDDTDIKEITDISVSVLEMSTNEYLHNCYTYKKGYSYSVWKFLYKKEVVENVWFEKDRVWEDVLYTAEILTKSESVAFVNAELYAYRINPQSISRVFTYKHAIDFIFVHTSFAKLLAQNGYNEYIENYLLPEVINFVMRVQRIGLSNDEQRAIQREIKTQKDYYVTHGIKRKLQLFLACNSLPLLSFLTKISMKSKEIKK